MTDDAASVISDGGGVAVDTDETVDTEEALGADGTVGTDDGAEPDATGGRTVLMSNSSAGTGGVVEVDVSAGAEAVDIETVGGSAGGSSENIGVDATGTGAGVATAAATGTATAWVTVDAAGVDGSGACVGSVWGSVMCSSPDRAPLKSRMPLPSERPTSGSRFGPRTSSATTRMNKRWVGWRMSPTTTSKLSADPRASTAGLDG